jgi:hypothetical protein
VTPAQRDLNPLNFSLKEYPLRCGEFCVSQKCNADIGNLETARSASIHVHLCGKKFGNIGTYRIAKAMIFISLGSKTLTVLVQ